MEADSGKFVLGEVEHTFSWQMPSLTPGSPFGHATPCTKVTCVSPTSDAQWTVTCPDRKGLRWL